MMFETKRHEDEIVGLNKRVQALQSELNEQLREKTFSDSRVSELDQLVGKLLAVVSEYSATSRTTLNVLHIHIPSE